MENLKGTARRALAQVGLRRGPHEILPTTGGRPGKYNPVDHEDDAGGGSDNGDDEHLLASSPSEERDDGSDLATMACEKAASSCGCACHLRQKPTPRSRARGLAWATAMTPARIHLFASLFWVLGVLLIIVAFRRQRDGSVPVGGTFGWCMWRRALSPSPFSNSSRLVADWWSPILFFSAGGRRWRGRVCGIHVSLL